MVGASIQPGTILTEIPEKMGSTSYKDGKDNTFTFDNSEIVFSPQFHKSFIKL